MQRGRALGYFETVLKYFFEKSYGLGQVGAIVRVIGPLTEELFRKSLNLLYQHHPLLGCTITEIDNQSYFSQQVAFEQIPIVVRHEVSLEKVDLYVQQETNCLIDPQHHLWRALLLLGTNEHEIIFTFHHSIGDGISFAFLVKELLSYCEELLDHQEINIIPFDFFPPIEFCISEAVSWEKYKKHLKPEIIEPTEMTIFPYYTTYPLSDQRTQNMFFEYDQKITQSLVANCRKNHTSVNAILNALLLLTMRYLINEKELNVFLNTPVNLRSKCSPPLGSNILGCYVAKLMTAHLHINAYTDIWMLAREYRAKLKERIEKGYWLPKTFTMHGLQELLSDRFIDQPASCHSSLSVTDVGKFEFKTAKNKFDVEKFFFCTGRVGGVPLLHVITTDYFLCFTLGFPNAFFSDFQKETFFSFFDELLRKVALSF